MIFETKFCEGCKEDVAPELEGPQSPELKAGDEITPWHSRVILDPGVDEYWLIADCKCLRDKDEDMTKIVGIKKGSDNAEMKKLLADWWYRWDWNKRTLKMEEDYGKTL